MVEKYDLGNLAHPSWTSSSSVDSDPPVVIPRGLQFTDPHVLKEWTVKLRFYSDGELGYGSGFFINIPKSPYDVILTAGHNLFSDKKAYTTNLTILFPNPDPSSAEFVSKRVDGPDVKVKVAAAYLSDPTFIEADYGAILLPRPPGSDGRGFGFNMTLAFRELKGDACISGYRVPSQPGRPILSTGPIVSCSATQLAYDATTERGISGSAVWIQYQGSQTIELAVVAIQFVFLTTLLNPAYAVLQ